MWPVNKYSRLHHGEGHWTGVGDQTRGSVAIIQTSQGAAVELRMRTVLVESIVASRVAVLQKDATVGFKYSLVKGGKKVRNRFQVAFADAEAASKCLAELRLLGAKTRIVQDSTVEKGGHGGDVAQSHELLNSQFEDTQMEGCSQFPDSQLTKSPIHHGPEQPPPQLPPAIPITFLMKPTPVDKEVISNLMSIEETASANFKSSIQPFPTPIAVSIQTNHSIGMTPAALNQYDESLSSSTTQQHGPASIALNTNSSAPIPDTIGSDGTYSCPLPLDPHQLQQQHSSQAASSSSFIGLSRISQQQALRRLITEDPEFPNILKIASSLLIERMLMD
ncbi:hypothetical protein BDR26DRAFT_929651 [Obelidium mucronatum]|nr:hypothetical protein BDR26DRAFT_929651 [Obelidium mucronatum]